MNRKSVKNHEKQNILLALFPFPPTSRQFLLISVTSGFTRLSMKTKYVCRGLIGLYVNFHNNRTMWSTNFHVKICRWGEGKRALLFSKVELKFQISQQKKSKIDLIFSVWVKSIKKVPIINCSANSKKSKGVQFFFVTRKMRSSQ